MNGDCFICVRIYPGVSKTPILHAGDKLALVRCMLGSLLEFCGDRRVRFVFLLDACPPVYEALIRRLFEGRDFEVQSVALRSNPGTFELQRRLCREQRFSDWVLIAEDDYLWVPEGLSSLLSAARSLQTDFLSPYDHLDYYSHPYHRFTAPAPVVVDGRTWKRVASTCLTFLASRSALERHETSFATYTRRNSDTMVWALICGLGWSGLKAFLFQPNRWAATQLAKYLLFYRQRACGPRSQLRAPEPSLATHLETGGVAPGVDWLAIARHQDERWGGEGSVR